MGAGPGAGGQSAVATGAAHGGSAGTGASGATSAAEGHKYMRLADATWSRMPKVNAELFTLTYGALVTQLIRDYETCEAVNEQLERMGYNIGTRLVDEFLAKTGVSSCSDFGETAETIAKVAFKMFLGITADVGGWNAERTIFSLRIHESVLTDFVEVPAQYRDLHYLNLLCGVIRGALEMVQLRVECAFIRDLLQGDDCTEIRVELKERMRDEMSEEYKEG